MNDSFIDNRKQSTIQGGRTHLPKFKFSANFPIGLHMILQIEIKKKMSNILCEKII